MNERLLCRPPPPTRTHRIDRRRATLRDVAVAAPSFPALAATLRDDVARARAARTLQRAIRDFLYNPRDGRGR